MFSNITPMIITQPEADYDEQNSFGSSLLLKSQETPRVLLPVYSIHLTLSTLQPHNVISVRASLMEARSLSDPPVPW